MTTEGSSGAPPGGAPVPSDVAPRAIPASTGRDTSIDFIRGWVMLILIIVHTEFFSLWNLLVWERVGMISGGEGFVLLAGLVLGMVSRQRIARKGWGEASRRLLDRALQLYRVHFTAILLVGLLALVFKTAFHEISSFTDRGSKTVYELYPHKPTFFHWIGSIATLKMGPHQVQVLGLYVCLIAICPLLIVALDKGRGRALLGLSWVIYFSNLVSPKMPTGAQFEYAFPLLTWQILFVHGLVAGYYFNEIQIWFRSRVGLIAFAACVAITLFFFVLVQSSTNAALPEWARFDLWPHFYSRLRAYGDKNTLGPLRLLNYAAFLVVIYAILTRWWPFFQRTMGWFLVPIGQATLYVFLVHIFVVQACAWILPFGFDHATHPLWLTTLLHTGELALLWLLVRYKVLFRWIPR